MNAEIIDGKAVAQSLYNEIHLGAQALQKACGVSPGLVVILIGDDPASLVYVKKKQKQARALGYKTVLHHLPEQTRLSEILALIKTLNEDETINGILVQLPLPRHLPAGTIINALSPDKDVDGLHPLNAGRLALGDPAFIPCTPLGCLRLLRHTLPGGILGLHAVVVGRSAIVGKPMAALLLQADCTVSIVHSRTLQPERLSRLADILVVAAGKPGLVTEAWVKPGTVVIDVGINRVEGRLIGDVDFASVSQTAKAITPVPGGVGPMTIACLMRNTLVSACRKFDVPIVGSA